MTASLGPRGAGPHMRLVRAVSPGCAPVRPRVGGPRARRNQRRARRVPHAPLAPDTAAAACASLAASGLRWRLAGGAAWTLTVAAHAALVFAVWRTRPAPPFARSSMRVTVQVHERPSPPHPSSHMSPATPPVAASRSAAPRSAPPTAVRVPRAPAAAAPKPVKVVGLSLESTSEAGPGPAFAVGETLGGTTAATAVAPRTAPPAEPPDGPNRIAPGAPRPGSVLTPPRRLNEVKPRYPDARRAAGVEADVLLVVSLDAIGRVLSVTVGRSSGDDAFDESARSAARQERFSPALRDGVPVPTTFTFTTRFRLDMP